jgi:hypothetical protein
MGLDEKEKLDHLFKTSGYNVLNFSRLGKSNIAIAQDTYNNSNNADVFVLGFTFAERFHFKYNLYDINLLPSNITWPTDSEQVQGTEIENILQSLHKNFYLLFDSNHWGNLSDMLVDNTINNLKFKNKKVFAFSWQSRQTQNKVLCPVIPNRFPDGHLNNIGTKKLFDIIQDGLGSP